jgi:hypothetical protein
MSATIRNISGYPLKSFFVNLKFLLVLRKAKRRRSGRL